jgi:HlyD family secretion protein
MEEQKPETRIELRSDEVQEIVSQVPGWTVRAGITMMLGFLVLLLIGSCFFHYPDMISARVVILSENPPAYLSARSTGKIDHLFVEDRQMVEKGQVIAVLENTANYDDAFRLEDQIKAMEPFLTTFDTTLIVRLDAGLQLGDIQSDYSGFVRLLDNYLTFLNLNFYPKKIKGLKEQVRMDNIYYDRLWAQRGVLESDLKIASNQFKRDSLLWLKGVLSELDLEKTKATLLEKKYNFNKLRSDLAETQRTILELEQQVVDSEMEFADQKKKLQNELVESMNVLKSRLSYWEQSFVLRTPIAGKVTFTNFWTKNQQVKKDDVVFSVVPEEQSEIIGRISLPLKGAGKVHEGQRVNIRFDNFPYMEYGMLQGTVKSISLLPTNDNYIVEVSVPQDLKTNYNIALNFSQEMKGDAEIVTEDLRLIQRIYNPVKYILKHRMAETK